MGRGDILKRAKQNQMEHIIHYFKLHEGDENPGKIFKNRKKRLAFLMDTIIDSRDKVFLLRIDAGGHKSCQSIYVFHSFSCIAFLLDNRFSSCHYIYYLHEFKNYEDAYRNALRIKEHLIS